MSKLLVQSFLDPDTETFSHIAYAGVGTACAIFDPVLDFDPKSGRTSTGSADQLIAFVHANQLQVEWIIETHAHADHLSAAPYLQQRLGGKTAIGQPIDRVQQVFKKLFHLEAEFATDGRQFDHLFAAGDQFQIGELTAHVLHVPGHTPADMAYRVEDVVFVGDTIFMPDVGTARCDFPGGDARMLYQSIQTLLRLPAETKLYLCHDYPPAGREHQPVSTVAEQRLNNIHVHDGISEEEFVQMRTQRDLGLAMPRLILPSVQVNIRAGQLPPAEANGVHYLKIPLNLLGHHLPVE